MTMERSPDPRGSHLMNCDEAFERMTSLSDRNSPELHAHLQNCPRCRDMQATIAPALGLFARDAAPAPWEVPDTTARDVAMQVAQRLTVSAPKRLSLRRSIGYLAAVVMGASLSWGAMALRSEARPANGASANSVCSYVNRPLNRDAVQLVNGYQMTQSCLACHSTAQY